MSPHLLSMISGSSVACLTTLLSLVTNCSQREECEDQSKRASTTTKICGNTSGHPKWHKHTLFTAALSTKVKTWSQAPGWERPCSTLCTSLSIVLAPRRKGTLDLTFMNSDSTPPHPSVAYKTRLIFRFLWLWYNKNGVLNSLRLLLVEEPNEHAPW